MKSLRHTPAQAFESCRTGTASTLSTFMTSRSSGCYTLVKCRKQAWSSRDDGFLNRLLHASRLRFRL